jgi:hypothetical protein
MTGNVAVFCWFTYHKIDGNVMISHFLLTYGEQPSVYESTNTAVYHFAQPRNTSVCIFFLRRMQKKLIALEPYLSMI